MVKTVNKKNNKTMNERAQAASAGLVLEVASNQYSVQWTKIGNLQTSAGSVLSLISLVSAVLLGVISAQKSISFTTENISYINLAFYVSTVMSIIYMVLSCVFMYLLLRTKYIQVLPNPSILQEQIIGSLESVKDSYNEDQQVLLSSTLLLEKINQEIINTDTVLNKNRFWYGKCLNSSFFSLISRILALLFVNSHIFNNNNFFLSIISICSYLILLSFFILIFFPRRIG